MTPIDAPVQVIKDLKGSDYSWSYQTPPSSPSSSSSRKSSMCRSVRGCWVVGRMRGYSGRQWGSSHKDCMEDYFRAPEFTQLVHHPGLCKCRGKIHPMTRLLLAWACVGRSRVVRERLHLWNNNYVPGAMLSALRIFFVES